jgi:hypothetical protein
VKRRYLTFEERGVHAGFRARRIAFARCRKSRYGASRIESLVPNWSGESAGPSNDLVMPWSALPDWSLVEGYDRFLHEAISREFRRYDGHLDPIMLDDVRQKVNLEHGTETMRAKAARDIAIAQRDCQRSLLDIIAMFGRQSAAANPAFAGLKGATLFQMAERSPAELRALVRMITASFSNGRGVSGQELRERLDRVAEFAAPICTLVTADTSETVGYLSQRFQSVERMHDEVRDYAAGRGEDLQADTAAMCANTMTFLMYGHARAEALRRKVLDQASYATEEAHQELLALIASERVRIAYALDGWASHAEIWERARETDDTSRLSAVGQILRDMPKPPAEVDAELRRVQGDAALMSFRGKHVREFHSWSTDELDEELYVRVQTSLRGTVNGVGSRRLPAATGQGRT